MKTKESKLPRALNRYTTLPILLDMLWAKRIELRKPENWEDRSDAYFLEQYRLERNLSAIFAVCFAGKPETFHHWRVFSHGHSGVCVEFKTHELLPSLKCPGFRFGPVRYRRIDALEKKRPALSTWPFLKRQPFKDEKEFRAIYEGPSNGQQTWPLEFDVDAIAKITLSPWLPPSVAKSVQRTIESIPDCSALVINHSTLLESRRWKRTLLPASENS